MAFLDQCFRTNKDRTKQLLIYNLENWGGQSCLSLAYAIDHEEFIAHVSCQSVLTEIWTGYMRTSQNSSLKVRNSFLQRSGQRLELLKVAKLVVFFTWKI